MQTTEVIDATYYIYKQMGHCCEHLEEVDHSQGHYCNLFLGFVDHEDQCSHVISFLIHSFDHTELIRSPTKTPSTLPCQKDLAKGESML